MCKSIKYWFSCQHGFRLRASQCGGTKHKTVRGGLIAACNSESYLNIVIPILCGPCQYQAFEEGWKRKLLMAETFLQKLQETSFPGVQEVVALAEELTDEFNTASWNTRSLFPHFPKENPMRVNLGQFKKRPSPLRRGLLPEDIPEPTDAIHPEHPDYEYDWDYIASTDPLHPVDTNYSYPLDDVDPSWMLNHLSLEEFEKTSEEVGFDPSEIATMWTDKAEGPDTKLTHWREDANDWTLENTATDSAQQEPRWDAQAETHASFSTAGSDLSPESESIQKMRLEMIIHEFWSAVNDEDFCNHSQQDLQQDEDVDTRPGEHHIQYSSRAPSKPPFSLPTPPRTPPRLPTTGTCEEIFPFTTQSPGAEPEVSRSAPIMKYIRPSIIAPQGVTTPCSDTKASRPARTFYDRWRRHISGTKDVDRIRFNKDLLLLSRCEIRDAEGPSGRLVPDPPVLQDGGAKNGWFS